MVIYFQRTVGSIINMQRFIKQYFKRKMYWQALLKTRLEKEIQNLKSFISLMIPLEHKRNYEWILNEVQLIEPVDVQIICKRMIQHLKDLQVMDTYLYNT